MEYKALYRQWRPKSFADVVGQEHITRTLKNAISNQKTAHAYLFCGPRGTGKTSTAKIIGKSVNCLAPQQGEPCNQCDNCRRIDRGNAMDVQEIDAASNRGIEEIRDLREKVKYAPSEGKYKVYIIDEVHMLTTEAFNALLKTLEEPPQHVLFVLATTEPHKIPATILSRCQRFDFRRIAGSNIVSRLKQVIEQIEVDIEEDAVLLISKAANGGLRDALSILDQCIAYSEGRITVQEVTEVLGTVTQETVLEIAQLMLDRDLAQLLQLVNSCLDAGKDPYLLLQDLLEHCRNIFLAKVCQQPGSLLVLPEEIIGRIQEQAAALQRAQLEYIIETFSSTEANMKWAGNARLLLELGLIKAANYQEDISLQMLSQRLAELERKVGESGRGRLAKGVTPAVVKEEELLPKKTAETTVTLEQIKAGWETILKRVKKANISTYAFLVEAKAWEINQGILVLGYSPEYNFHRERMSQEENRTLVEQILSTVFGQKLKVECVSLAEHPEKEKKQAEEDVLQKAEYIFGKDNIEEEN